MRISELSQRSGASIATIKYYLREDLLHPGQALNARQSAYDETHLERVRLIRGLVHILGASIGQVRQILSVVETPDQSPLQAMAQARTVPPVGPEQADAPAAHGRNAGPTIAENLLQQLDWTYDPASPYLRELDEALALSADVGISLDEAQIAVYASASRQIAAADFDRIPWQDAKQAVQFAVLGTALYEPVLLALRRIAHDEQGMLLAERQESAAGDDEGSADDYSP